MENSIKNRVQKIMELEQLNPASFAKAIQVNPSAISHILNERNKPSTEIIVKILNTFRSLNSDWLILGIGSMYRNEKISNTIPSSLTPSLFDVKEDEIKEESFQEPSVFQKIQENKEQVVRSEPAPPYASSNKSAKSIKKIIVYYSDNSFEEMIPSID